MTLIRHELRQSWKTVLIWTLALSFFLIVAILVYPEMKGQMEAASSMFSSMGAFTAAFGMDKLDFGTAKGYYAVECGNIMGLGGALFAALVAMALLSKEEKNGTAEFLLTNPLNRSEVITAKLASLVIQILALNLGVFLLSAASVAAIGEAVFWKELILLHTAFLLLQLEIGGICFGLSACVRRGGLGIGLGLAIGLYFMSLIANLSDKLSFLKYITPFGYADSGEIMSKGALSADKIVIGMALMLCGIVLAYRIWCRKDIR